jgi:hypothetical protein
MNQCNSFHGTEHIEEIRTLETNDLNVRKQEVLCLIQRLLEDSQEAQDMFHLLAECRVIEERISELLSIKL